MLKLWLVSVAVLDKKNLIKKVSQVKSKLHFPICETKKMKKKSIGMSFWSSHQLYLSFLAYMVVRSFSIFDLTTLHRALLLHGAVHISKKVVKIILKKNTLVLVLNTDSFTKGFEEGALTQAYWNFYNVTDLCLQFEERVDRCVNFQTKFQGALEVDVNAFGEVSNESVNFPFFFIGSAEAHLFTLIFELKQMDFFSSSSSFFKLTLLITALIGPAVYVDIGLQSAHCPSHPKKTPRGVIS